MVAIRVNGGVNARSEERSPWTGAAIPPYVSGVVRRPADIVPTQALAAVGHAQPSMGRRFLPPHEQPEPLRERREVGGT